jgi:CHAD domain-containing protein
MSSRAIQTIFHHQGAKQNFPGLTDSPQIAKWIHAVLVELDEVRQHFKPGHVHDLRIALRRCRSVALGVEQLDPTPAWTRLRKESKRLLDALGDVRDLQVTREWVSRLGMHHTESGLRLCAVLEDGERQAISRARKELDAADERQWRKWARQLPARAERIRCGGPAAELLALDGWRESWELHKKAIHSRSKVSFHRLRVGIKRFRYSVESFLPGRYGRWGRELKELQDLLGEAHDLDVLWAALIRLRPALAPEERNSWRGTIDGERGRRLAAYRAKMTGPNSRWQVWRASLPEGYELERARLDWLAVWAAYLDPDPVHSGYVARLALEIYDSFKEMRVPIATVPHGRILLEAAAILDDVGRAEGDRHHQKTSYRLIRKRTPPPGWSKARMEAIARIARYHRGALPTAHENHWSRIPEKRQEGVMTLAAILRLATALASDRESPITTVTVENMTGSLVIVADGFKGDEPLASRLAAARHLLESLLHRAIVIQPAGIVAKAMTTSA